MKTMMQEDRWAMRFFRTASLNGLITVVWTFLIVWPDFNMSRIIAGGWPGTWLFVGYVMWIMVGCPGMVICGTVRYIVPKITGRKFRIYLTGTHLVLTEVGAAGATWLLGYAGYVGGSLGLQGATTAVIHSNIFGYSLPVSLFVGVAILGVLIGIIDLIFSKAPPSS